MITQKIFTTFVATIALNFMPQMLMAYDSGDKTLSNTVGATDFYQISCPISTHHVSFQIIDLSPVVQPAPQLLNLHIKKTGYNQTDLTQIKPGETKNLTLAGATGKYTVVIDSENTNLELTTAQSFQYQYACNYADGSTVIKPKSTKKSLKNGLANKPSKASFSLSCPAKKKSKTPTIEAESITVTLFNNTKETLLTSSSQLLNAQVTKRDQEVAGNDQIFASNATDINGNNNTGYGDLVPRVDRGRGGNTDFFMTVSSTSYNKSIDNSKIYNFRFNCLGTANDDLGVPTIVDLRDM